MKGLGGVEDLFGGGAFGQPADAVAGQRLKPAMAQPARASGGRIVQEIEHHRLVIALEADMPLGLGEIKPIDVIEHLCRGVAAIHVIPQIDDARRAHAGPGAGVLDDLVAQRLEQVHPAMHIADHVMRPVDAHRLKRCGGIARGGGFALCGFPPVSERLEHWMSALLRREPP